MAPIGTVCAVALTIGATMVAIAPTWAGPDSQNPCPGPLPPKETVYRPDCGPDIALIDSGYPRCVRAAE